MPKIKVELNHEIIDGQPITFVAPCDCSEADGLRVSFPGGVRDFVFKDSHGNDLSDISELFLSGAYVRVLVNTVNGYAYIQNADTNAYLEAQLNGKAASTHNHAAGDITSGTLSLERGGTGRDLSTIEPYSIIRAASNSAYLLATPTANGAFFATGDNKAATFGTLPIEQGGTGATTAVQACDNLKALNIDHISNSDTDHIVPEGADLNNYTTPGAYKISSATITKTLTNAPPFKNGGGRLIVSALSATAVGTIQVLVFNTTACQIWYRIQATSGTWGGWRTEGVYDTSGNGCRYVYSSDGVQEWINPPMELNTEYRTTERYQGRVVYTKLYRYGYYSKSTTSIAHKISNIYTPISVNLINNETEDLTNMSGLSLCFNRTNIVITSPNDMGNVDFLLKYTK